MRLAANKLPRVGPGVSLRGLPKLLSTSLTASLVIAGLLVGSWILLQVVGGTDRFAPHWFYLPILVAGWRFGSLGAVVSAAAAGLLAGPLAPADVDLGTAQLFTDWSSRALAFLLIGFAMGAILGRLDRAVQAQLGFASKLREVSELEATILQSVSHEFRTPLTMIKGGARTLEKGTVQPEKASELLGAMVRAAQRLEDLVGVVLAAGGANRSPVAERLVSLEDVLEDLSHELAAFGGPARLKILTDRRADRLLTDPELVRLLLRLVVENALKFSPADSEVEVVSALDGGSVEIRVSNRGPGIPEDFLERAFDAFSQADPSTTRAHEGLGLGLFAALRIARQLGGSIDLARQESGTEVILRLPKGSVHEAIAQGEDDEPQLERRKRPLRRGGLDPKRRARRTTDVLGSAMDEWREPEGRGALFTGLVTLLMIVAGGALVYFTGGTKLAYLHVMYVPIIVAAFSFSVPGGIVAGIVAALVVGPFMPIDVDTGAMQQTEGWLFRMGFFVLVGVVVGQAQSLLRARLARTESALEKVEATHGAALKTFASTVSLRDRPTGGHCERVGHNAALLASALRQPRELVEVTYWAGILHDLGKIAIPENILLKTGKLTDAEWEVMREHAEVGAGLIEQLSPDFTRIAEGVRFHHERWDGGGYPVGLKGEEIPLAARIVALVDVFEALTSERPYREPMAHEEAFGHVRGGAGSHFDPAVVEMFEDLYQRGLIRTASDSMPAPLSTAPPQVGVSS